MTTTDNAPLEATFELGFTYTRSLGPVIGTCFAALAERRLLGMRRSDGSVLFPPLEYDPDTAEALSEWVELTDTGTVVGFSWVRQPRAQHREDAPFAWALIQLDGADTPFLHKVRAANESDIAPGLRIKALWIDEPQGDITDIAAFVPEEASSMKLPAPKEAVERPIYLNYRYRASVQANRFLHAIKQGRILGVRSVGTGKVLVPPPGVCSESGTLTPDTLIELPDVGTVLSFTTVHLPIPNSRLKPPFVVANILLDGAGQAFSHIVSECEPADVTIGTRVKAHWKPEADWDFGLENIEYFVPSGEPLVDIDALRARRLEEARRHA